MLVPWIWTRFWRLAKVSRTSSFEEGRDFFEEGCICKKQGGDSRLATLVLLLDKCQLQLLRTTASPGWGLY